MMRTPPSNIEGGPRVYHTADLVVKGRRESVGSGFFSPGSCRGSSGEVLFILWQYIVLLTPHPVDQRWKTCC